MNRPLSAIVVVSLSILLAASSALGGAEERAKPDDVEAKIRKLQQARVSVLQQAVEVTTAQYRAGVLHFKAVQAAQHELLEARIEIAETRQERIKLMTSQLKIARQALVHAEAGYQAADTTKLDVFQATSAVLRIEIDLLKLQRPDATKKTE